MKRWKSIFAVARAGLGLAPSRRWVTTPAESPHAGSGCRRTRTAAAAAEGKAVAKA